MPLQPNWGANLGQWGARPSQWNNARPQGMTFPTSQSNCGPNSTRQFQSVQSPPPIVGSKGAHLPLMPPPSSFKPCLPINKTILPTTNVELEPSKQLLESKARAVK
jgi:hypothetical protein